VTTLPLADAPLLRRLALRTRALRIALAAALVAIVLVASVLARHPATTAHPFLPPGSTGIVVLDLSASISTDSYQQIGETLKRLAASGGRYGLIVFSSTAYLALPPETPARELGSLVRFFRFVPGQNGFGSTFPTNPWTTSFSAGTAISSGLDLALDLVRREQLARPSVLLISDLSDDPGDLRRVASSALALRREHVPLHVVALSAQAADAQLFSRLLGPGGAVQNAPAPGTAPTSSHTAFPTGLVIAALLAATLLAAGELLFPTLRFGTEAAR
jgi:hypothetical protein